MLDHKEEFYKFARNWAEFPMYLGHLWDPWQIALQLPHQFIWFEVTLW